MANRKSKSAWGGSPLFTIGCFVYFLGGYTLMNKYWPNSDVGLWILIAVGMAGGYFILKRRRERG